jgi:membrane-associated phospholipid phosphatase
VVTTITASPAPNEERSTGSTRPDQGRRLRAFTRRIRPEECLFAVFATALVVLVLVTGAWRVVDHRLLAGFRYVAIVGGVALIIMVRGYFRTPPTGYRILGVDRGRLRAGARYALRTTREFGPLFACLALYEALHDLTPIIRPHVEDRLLVASDHFLFHADVGVWLNTHIGSPTMTSLLTYCYVSYAFASPIYAGIQYVRGNFRAFHDFALAITITAFIGYSGYLLLPAVGPYVYQHALYPHPLPGWGHGGILDIIAKMKGSARDAFPSLHTAMTTVVLGMMWRDARRLFWTYLPIALGLYVSTMYLRVHYATDVIAGFVVGFTALFIAPKINRWWYAHRAVAVSIPRQREGVRTPTVSSRGMDAPAIR